MWDNTGPLWLFAVLEASLLGGVGLGLLVSALVDSEEAAVASLPLLIMPQLLLNGVAAGQIDQRYDDAHPFRPLALLLSDWGDYNFWTGRLVDLASLLCISRPAAFLAESPSPWISLGDLCHLVVLLAATWAASYYAFLRREIDWRRERFVA